jgi:feruloyl esterase
MMTRRFATAFLLMASSVPVGRLAGQGSETPTATCSVAALQAAAPTGTTITGAATVEAASGPGESAIPRHCRVDGHVAVPGNAVNFRLGLPVNWNGKFYFQGVGGLGGNIGSLETGLSRGYASA